VRHPLANLAGQHPAGEQAMFVESFAPKERNSERRGESVFLCIPGLENLSAPMPARSQPSYLNFDKVRYLWKHDVDYRAHSMKYRVGKGEQGVLICEPYKSEIIPQWRFKTASIANQSAKMIFAMFVAYLKDGDFVGADMARKFLQMGYTRARRYANYKGGRKYDKTNNYALEERGCGDPEKAESAAIFHKYWKKAEANEDYAARKKQWKERYG
jgi:hypothetical protein